MPCICKGTLSQTVAEYSARFDHYYKYRGDIFLFAGITIASDDYYYAMVNINTGKTTLCSCVGNLEGDGGHEFEYIGREYKDQ